MSDSERLRPARAVRVATALAAALAMASALAGTDYDTPHAVETAWPAAAEDRAANLRFRQIRLADAPRPRFALRLVGSGGQYCLERLDRAEASL